MKRIILLFLAFILSFSSIACETMELESKDETENHISEDNVNIEEDTKNEETDTIEEDGYYTSKDQVALYIHTYNKLPKNYIEKKEALDLGWQSSKGNLWDVSEKKSIGGDKFGNREKLLPIKEGRQYYECDIDYEGGYRGPERIVYSDDGLIYYTEDHYESFILLYGDE